MSCKALYIHVPFCERKCPYCDFYSVPAREELMDAYVSAVRLALERQPFSISGLDSVYFGGGTPSVLGGARMARLLEAAARRFTVAPDAEITVECNPQSALAEDLRLMRAAGANRLSMGMQSVDDAQLRLLGRLHTASDVPLAVETARNAGFAHISLDLMLATPRQTLRDIENAVSLCARLEVEHVSAYLLKVEEGTPFAARHIETDCPDEDGQADAYLHAVSVLASHGYEQYEISNFARDGLVARHNLNYWDCGEYLGIGPSAHSFIEGRRRYFERDLPGFLAAENPFELLKDDGEGGDVQEYLMLRARLTEGIVWKKLAARYPRYDPAPLREKARRLADGGLAVLDGDGLRLTRNGFLLSNSVLAELL